MKIGTQCVRQNKDAQVDDKLLKQVVKLCPQMRTSVAKTFGVKICAAVGGAITTFQEFCA